MKRATRKVEKQTFTLKNAIPRFVSIVSRGANFAPLSELRYADNEAFSDVEINQIVFSKEKFSREAVEQYLTENDYEEFQIEEDEATFIVPGLEADKFEELTNIEYVDGVKFYVGKLKDSVEAQTTAVVTDAEVLDFQEPEAELVQEGASEEAVEQAEQEIAAEAVETVQEGDTVNEEAKPEESTSASEEGQDELVSASEENTGEVQEEVVQEAAPEADPSVAVFNEQLFKEECQIAFTAFLSAITNARTLSFSAPVEEVELFTAEQVQSKVDEAVAEAIAQYNNKENEETVETTIDETPILVQNSQAVNTEDNSTDSQDERTTKFSQRKSQDLFGLR